MIRDLEKQEAEDIVIFDHKIHVPNPKLSSVDAPILKFRAWAKQFYVSAPEMSPEDGDLAITVKR